VIHSSCFTISGPPGSGTSTASWLLASHLGYRHIDVGTLFREMAVKAGVTLEDFDRMAEENHQIDRDLDAKMVEIARSDAHALVLEGRLTGILLRREKIECFAVRLDAPEEIRAVRIAQRDKVSFQEAFQHLREREVSEQKRYHDIYGIDVNDLSIYDLIINSEKYSPEEIIAKIIIRSGVKGKDERDPDR